MWTLEMFFMMLVTMTVGLLHTTMDNLGVRASTQKALKNVAAGRLIGNIWEYSCKII